MHFFLRLTTPLPNPFVTDCPLEYEFGTSVASARSSVNSYRLTATPPLQREDTRMNDLAFASLDFRKRIAREYSQALEGNGNFYTENRTVASAARNSADLIFCLRVTELKNVSFTRVTPASRSAVDGDKTAQKK